MFGGNLYAGPDALITGCAVIDFEWNILHRNKTFTEHFNISISEASVKNILELKGDRERDFYSTLNETMSGRIPSGNEILLGDTLNQKWLEIKCLPVAEGIFIQSLDITRFRIKEQELSEREEKFRKAFFANPYPLILSTAAEGIVIDVNDSFTKFFGWSREEITGKSSIDLNMYRNPADREKVISLIKEQGKIRHYELDITTKKGIIKNTLLSAEIVDTREGKILLTSLQDITLLKESEKRINDLLQVSQRRAAELEAVIQSIPDAIFIGTSKGIFTCNQNGLNLLGISSVKELQTEIAVLGKKLNVRSIETGKPLQGYELPFTRALRGEKVHEEVAATKITTGEDIIIRIAGAPIVLNNEIIGAVTVDTDITELKKAEKIIRASLKEKEFLLQETYHRTKNHMQVISSLMSIRASAVDNPELTKIVEEMKQQIQSMALVHQKLYQSEDLSTVLLNSYIYDLADKLKLSFTQNSAMITINYEMDDVSVPVDAAIACGLIITEIITNSFKYAFTPGIQGIINIILKEENKMVYLEISDNGKGIKEETPEPGKLGMQLVNMIAEDKLDGETWFSFEKGVSWKFRFKNKNQK